MKKFLYRLFGFGVLSMLWLSSILWIVNAQDQFWGATSTEWIAWISWVWQQQWGKLIDGIKVFINRVLGMLSIITLVILLRWGFQMVTAAWDDAKYKEWMKILKQAWFGLAFIWLSWLIVSVIFRVIGKVAGN
jgi:hypothetical protein